MKLVRDGIPASPGIVIGPAHVLRWEVPKVARSNIAPDEVEAEVTRMRQACDSARDRIREIQEQTAERLGSVEAQIFEPQILMLEDVELIDAAITYVRENHVTAARALELRVLELRSEWQQLGHPMVMDRLTDLLDVEIRLLRELLDMESPVDAIESARERSIVVAHDLTPSLAVQLDRETTLGIALDTGSRTSHTAILARALGIPAVVGLGELSDEVAPGTELILDGRSGRVLAEPNEEEKRVYRERDVRVREWEQELVLLAHMDSVTPDRQPVQLRANIDLPGEAEIARRHGAEGIGLFRTEFLVVGRSAFPGEEEQYQAYRQATEVFPDHTVCIRTYDLGGDKFPRFLRMPSEENPFLGWRGIRVCLDMPDLFRAQLRAVLRATAHGDVRVMLPLINEIDEVERTREMLEELEQELDREGIDYTSGYKLGVMIETPAAVLIAEELARHADFFSIGTNDLIQYTLAVDRGNARLASRYTAFHPAVVKLLRRTAESGRRAGIEVSVCGEMAANPLGVFLLLGLGITALSVSPSALPEIKKVVRTIPATAAREAAAAAVSAASPDEVIETLTAAISEWLDLSLFSGRWNVSPLQ
ncbi:MAG: phosphoenolpyruvate--protein phosphotransferase [Longimicrobiales bacterium]